MGEIEFQRFNRIASFVRTLSLQGDSLSRVPDELLQVPEFFLQYLESKASRGPLLPNLRECTLGRQFKSLAVGSRSNSQWGLNPRAARLCHLFLGSTITNLTVWYPPSGGALDLHSVACKAPNITCLGIYYEVQRRSDSGLSSAAASSEYGLESDNRLISFGSILSAWGLLVDLSVGDTFLTRHTARPISLLPSLTYLTVVRNGPIGPDWGMLPFDSKGFAVLEKLTLRGILPSDAASLVRRPSLLRNVQRIQWSVQVGELLMADGDDNEDPSRAFDLFLGHLADHAHSLREVNVYRTFGPSLFIGPTSIGLGRLLVVQTLEILILFGVTSKNGLETIFMQTDLSYLRMICIHEAKIPFSALAIIADRFPELRTLEIGLLPISSGEVDQLSNLPRASIARNVVLCLATSFSHSAIFPGMSHTEVLDAVPKLSQ